MQGISVYSRAGRPCWYVAYDCPDRHRRVCVSTGILLTDPRGKIAAYAFAREKSKSGVAHRGSRDLSEWHNWVLPWLTMRFAFQKKTLSNYLGAWKFLSVYLHENQVRVPRALNYQHVVGFVLWREQQVKRSGRRPGRNTALHNVKTLSRVMGEAVRRGFATGNPCLRITNDVPKAPVKPKPAYNDEQVALVRAALQPRMLKGEPEDWMPIAFEIALWQGCRFSATQVPMEKINFAAGEIEFHEKGDKFLTVPIHPQLRPLLERLRDEGRAVTCKLPTHASRYFTEKMKQLGLPHTFHCTRVTVISRLGEGGVPEQLAMAYVGHSSWAVHKGYHFKRIRPVAAAACHQALAYAQASSHEHQRPQSPGVPSTTLPPPPASNNGLERSAPPSRPRQAAG